MMYLPKIINLCLHNVRPNQNQKLCMYEPWRLEMIILKKKIEKNIGDNIDGLLAQLRKKLT